MYNFKDISCPANNDSLKLRILIIKGEHNHLFTYFCIMESKRQERISKLLQKDLGEIIQMELRHVTKGSMVTVTKVYVSPDLGLAKSYLSIFATDNKAEVLKGIRIHNGEIRGKLGRRIRHQLRVVPELQFYLDDSLDYIENIENLLKD